MLISAKELSIFLKGEIIGDPDVKVHSPSKIEEGKEGTISFLANPKYEQYAYSTQATILLVNKDFEPSKEIHSTLIKVEDVYASVGILLEQFGSTDDDEFSISPLAFIDDDTRIDDKVNIAEYVVIKKGVKIARNTFIHPQVSLAENVQIGKGCILYPGVKVYADTVIGNNCIIHAGAVIGSDGFGYSKDKDGVYTKLKHVGNVILEDNVEIGANTVVDRGTMGSTIIRKGVKLDNLIQIAHNVDIGENTAIAAQSGVAGSSKLGKRVMVGGQVGIAGHRKIADDVQIQAKSGVISNVREVGKKMYGYPAIEYHEYLKAYALMRKLPDLNARIKELEQKIQSLLDEKSR